MKLAFNQKGMHELLGGILEQLDMCKKSLSDFLDGRRQQFPRYYFVSEADLLDILSNGNNPKKILAHVPKVFLATKSIKLSESKNSNMGRPIATEFIAGVGSEVCAFKPPYLLMGKLKFTCNQFLMHRSILYSVISSVVLLHIISKHVWSGY